MEPIPPKQQDMVDVTDSLEAVDAARGMRFFLFWFVLFPALLILQLIFWLNFAGRVENKNAETPSAAVSWVEQLLLSGPVYLAAEVPPAEPAPQSEPQPQTAPEQPAQNAPAPAVAEQPADAPIQEPAADQSGVQREDIEKGVSEVTGGEITDPAAVVPMEEEQPSKARQLMAQAKLSYGWAKGIVKVCNFLILFAAMLYCLILLLCLKISLVGRLGGLFHITKAFLISLLLLLVLVPWQVLLPRVMIGALWRPDELLNGWDRIDDSIFWQVLYFLRFTGMWLLAMVLLFWSRGRFVKWRRATLRRLGVLR